jgi:hypothetical protein
LAFDRAVAVLVHAAQSRRQPELAGRDEVLAQQSVLEPGKSTIDRGDTMYAAWRASQRMVDEYTERGGSTFRSGVVGRRVVVGGGQSSSKSAAYISSSIALERPWLAAAGLPIVRLLEA